jgi:DNA-binding transcriptional MerR regulator
MQLLTIQKAAEQAGLSPGTLRTYERAGLLSPHRDSAGRRVFTAVEVAQARRIAAERLAGRGRGLRGARVLTG